MNKQTLVLKKVFNLSKRSLFDAWSDPEVMRKWFFAVPQGSGSCSIDNQFSARGGGFKLVMHLDTGNDVEIHGKYKEINRYNTIVFTWNTPVVQDTLVKLKFKELSLNTSELTLEHSLLPTLNLVQQHEAGWNVCMENLERISSTM